LKDDEQGDEDAEGDARQYEQARDYALAAMQKICGGEVGQKNQERASETRGRVKIPCDGRKENRAHEHPSPRGAEESDESRGE
jgi:hypothetical protein